MSKRSLLAFAHHRLSSLTHLAAPGWFASRHHAFPGVTTDCHSRGGAKQLYGVGRSSLTQRPTVTSNGDAPETSPFRRLGYSKRWLDPRRVAASHRELAGESRPPSSFHPGQSGVGVVSLQLGRRAASVYACKSDCALEPEAGEGANPKQRGPGQCRNEATRGRAQVGHAPGS